MLQILICENRVHDATEPEITQELWGSGEVKEKRKRIYELIENLHLEAYFSDLDRRKAEEKQEQQENEKELQKEKDTTPAVAGQRKDETQGRSKSARKGLTDVVEIDD